MALEIIDNDVEEILVDVVLSQPQSDVFHAKTPLVLDMAGQGSGKTKNIGISSGYLISEFPELKGFIGANTHLQLSQSTLIRCFEDWKMYYGFTEYDAHENPHGDFVVDKKPPRHFKELYRLKNYAGSISFKTGALVFVGSLENYGAHDGKEFAWAHLDETKDTKKEALTTVILGRLRQYGMWDAGADGWVYDPELDSETAEVIGWRSCNPCYIHTSPAEGAVDWLLEMFGLTPFEKDIKTTITQKDKYWKRQTEETTVVIYSTYWNEHNLPPRYISGRLAIYSEEDALKFIWGYPFAKSGGEYYPGFSMEKHRGLLALDPNNSLHLAFDFNSVPYMTMVLAQIAFVNKFLDPDTKRKYTIEDLPRLPPDLKLSAIRVMQIRIVKEYCYRDPDNTTEDICEGFLQDMYAIKGKDAALDLYIYGDASGKSNIPGLGSLNNFKIIRNKLKRHITRGSMRVPGANPLVKKRRELMNRILEGKIPTVELIIDERCTNTVKDFNFVKRDIDGGKFKEKETDKVTKKKFEALGHTSDAVEYLVCPLLPDYLKEIH